jgi:hypothetical protein
MKPAGDKAFFFVVVALLVSFYEAFVLQQLWNWFVVPTFHLDPSGYPTMLGIRLIVFLFQTNDDGALNRKFQKLDLVVRACVPEEKQEALETAMKEMDGRLWNELKMWILGEFVGATISLILGAFISGLQ